MAPFKTIWKLFNSKSTITLQQVQGLYRVSFDFSPITTSCLNAQGMRPLAKATLKKYIGNLIADLRDLEKRV